VSKVVAVPQVRIVAVPDREGVHWKTFSGDVPLFAQVPASVLAPAVVPVNVPPADGTTVGFVQAPGRRVVLVVDDTVVVEVVVPARGGIVTGTVTTLLPSLSSAMRLNGSTDTRSV
jgi:hypothetical protein